MKYAWFIWLIITLYAFVPISVSSLWKSVSDDDLIIKSKACGCPCPDARVKNGQLGIPEIFLEQYPNIHKSQLNLTGNSPYQPFNFEIWLSDIKVTGEVIGVDTILCTETNCEFAPVFKVQSWTLVSYVAQFWTWNRVVNILYLIFVPVGFLGLVILTFKKRIF